MYSSHSVSIHSYTPWKPHKGWTKRIHETNAPQSSLNTGPAHVTGIHALAQVSHEIPPEAIQYAPPLSAYSENHCGSSVSATEYNRAMQMKALTGVRDVPVLSPQTQRRLDKLRQIRSTGYDTLAPIGISRTMRDLDEEAQLHEEDAEAPGVQAENSVAANTGHGGEAVAHAAADVSTGSAANTSRLEMPLPEIDLDARVHNADDSNVDDYSVDGPLSDSESTPDAFMAEDVEYQDDHSLFPDSVAGHSSIPDSHASFSTASVLSGANFAMGPNASTLPTATSNARACDDSDVDMTLE